jgi:hypothetical protein
LNVYCAVKNILITCHYFLCIEKIQILFYFLFANCQVRAHNLFKGLNAHSIIKYILLYKKREQTIEAKVLQTKNESIRRDLGIRNKLFRIRKKRERIRR